MSRPRQVAGLSAACGSAISISGPCGRELLRRNLDRGPADPTRLLDAAPCLALLAWLLRGGMARPGPTIPWAGLPRPLFPCPPARRRASSSCSLAEAGPDAALRGGGHADHRAGCCGRHRGLCAHYLRRADATLNADCLYLVAEIEAVSRKMQSRLGRARYFSPIVAGTGLGRHVGAAGPGPGSGRHPGRSCQRRLRHRRCRPVGPCARVPRRRGADGGYSYAPAHALAGLRPRRRGPERSWPRPATGLPASGLPPETVSASDPAAPLGGRLAPSHRSVLGGVTGLRPLPIVELPTRPTRGAMAIMISGDGGWRDLDKQVSGALQADGVPVVGLDALRWFWWPGRRRRPRPRSRTDRRLHRALGRREGGAGRLLLRRRRAALRRRPPAGRLRQAVRVVPRTQPLGGFRRSIAANC